MKALLGRLGFLGRTSRTTLINFLIICFFASVVLWFVFLKRLRDEVHRTELPIESFAFPPLWVELLQLAASLVWLWLSVRRFHDQDRPGWLALLPWPVGLAVALGVPVPPGLLLAFALGMLVALFLPGTIGPNSYGPDPRGWKSREHWLEQQRMLGKR